MPREGNFVADVGGKTRIETVADLCKTVKKDGGLLSLNKKYFQPNLSLMEVNMLFDHAKVSSRDVAPVILSDASMCTHVIYLS